MNQFMGPAIAVVGLSHHQAPIDVREKASLSEEQTRQLLRQLLEDEDIDEAFVVATCNRVEVFVVGALATETQNEVESTGRGTAAATLRLTAEAAGAAAAAFLAHAPDANRYLYTHLGDDAIRHLIRVAASLDSLVVGEPQILGQLKKGFELSREEGGLGPVLHRVFSRSVRGAKRIRSETLLGTGQVS
ncbi:MAG: glutamyl-tRNA reductase, partial [Polyangiaceae bacterium]|nr:glutamyl-tRNA reductase [Polyangiaceae bacterium]